MIYQGRDVALCSVLGGTVISEERAVSVFMVAFFCLEDGGSTTAGRNSSSTSS